MVIRGDFCIIRGHIEPAEAFKNEFIKNGCSIYEVLRILKGKPIFIDEHLKRLSKSANLTDCQVPTNEVIEQSIAQLVKANNIYNGNIEIVVNTIEDWSVRFIPHHWPGLKEYKYGVKTMLYRAVRENPNAKVKLMDLRAAVGNFMQQNNLYEAIYVNEGLVTEGSKSNIFFISGNTFITAPEKQVLPGITRKIVLHILEQHGYKTGFGNVHINELPRIDCAFLTGTSPGVLPIAQINDFKYDVTRPEMRHIMSLFEAKMLA